MFQRQILYCILLIGLLCNHSLGAPQGAKFYNTPMHEVSQFPTYLGVAPTGEVVVTYSGKGADLHPDDYITHADDVRILTGSLAEFLASGQREAAIPVIDDEDVKFGGSRLLGFVMIQSILPRKIQSRRGEILFDFEEGGPAPDIQVGNVVIGGGSVKTVDDEDYKPPPHGGGRCITTRDCFMGNGTCTGGFCSCVGDYTGSYCQLHRPETGSISKMAKKAKQTKQLEKPATDKPPPVNSDLPKPPPEQDTLVKVEYKKETQPASQEETKTTTKKKKLKPGAKKKPKPSSGGEESGDESGKDKEGEKGGSKKKKPDKGNNASNENENSKPKPKPSAEETEPQRKPGGPLTEEERMETIARLYGPGKDYPEPYLAGKVPKDIVHLRHKARIEKQKFTYAVRFRAGPFGLSFDNRLNNKVVVERVVSGQQAESSDIQIGDQLIAVDQYNTTMASPKDIQRLTSTLSWPRILTFETKGGMVDKKKLASHALDQTVNISVVFPPPLVAEFQGRLADWTPHLDASQVDKGLAAGGHVPSADACTIYYTKAASDKFGCDVASGTYSLSEKAREIIAQRGNVDEEAEKMAPMLTALLKEGDRRQIPLAFKSAAIMSRGVCNFVQKAKITANHSAGLALLVNTDETIFEIPAGKDNTSQCVTPFASIKQGDGALVQLTASYSQEVLLIATHASKPLSVSCTRAETMIADIIDQWAHSVPHVPVSKVLATKPPGKDKLRPPADEGGRVAVGGENGWAFFDYHLAVFGPQEVPLGPHRLQMAFPPHGCDPNAYTVRIKDTVVAILRGGGCSFGIKVINAQKLGAKAVIIVNTDDVKTMRLMAMPDEEPLIKIPCITISRRLQYYLEKQLNYFYILDQHVISIQPTGLFGEYEERNTLALPQRLPGH